jgi:hypothetical protein
MAELSNWQARCNLKPSEVKGVKGRIYRAVWATIDRRRSRIFADALLLQKASEEAQL